LRRNFNKKEEEVDENIIKVENIKINKNKKIVKSDKIEVNLTKNEYDILVKICEEN
jgi:DNA-binding response OmpR family regulator